MTEVDIAARVPRIDFLPAHVTIGADTRWIEESPVKWWTPLRFFSDGGGFVELMRMSPGALMPLHRHTGEIHAFNLSGERLLSSGERIGPGDYVFEPPGNVDWWKVIGEVPMTVLVVVKGTVEFLNADGTVRARVNALTQLDAYRRYCEQNGVPVRDLLD
ncbi:cupin domain-containing protein [Trinickia sp. LjRoot230]|uniref:cupin domain-containing protein n=1 Tax=Trinickia sp. LjRoot230 TaxID=3342288 RepID=UPI003ED01E22